MVVPPATGGMPSMTASPSMRNSLSNGYATTSAPRGKMAGNSAAHAAGASQPEKPQQPLSIRKAQPLDLSTVERRGQANAPREKEPKTSRPHGLQEAPTFRPTEEEFKDPFEYIRKIAPEGAKYGLVKIIPPEGWDPDFAIDTETFHFRTRRQELNLAEGGTRANLNYLDQLAKFHKQRSGTNLNRFPSVDKRPLDLYKLKKFVEDKGGFDTVCRQKRWAEIGRDLGYSGKIMSSLSTSLKNSFQKWLQPYEDWLKFNKPNVLHQQEIENGGPYTPSPAQTPIASHRQTPNSMRPSSPAARASAALNSTLQDGHSAPIPSVETAPPRPPTTSGFTAVNAGGGFTAVNAPTSSYSAINTANGRLREADPVRSTGRSTPRDSPFTPAPQSSKGTPSLSHLSQALALNGNASALKRHLSTDTDGNAEESVDASGRRSKRHKKDAAPTVTGSHMVQPRLPAPHLHPPRDRSKEKPGEQCESCGKADEPTAILLCDSCDAGYHRYCLEPPLKATPETDWHCPKCLVGTGDFGFEEGGIYSLKQFQEKAKHFKDNYFAGKMPFDPVLNAWKPVTEEDVEKEFWRLTESLVETVEVEYGADIHSTTHGSGFPTINQKPDSPYCMDPWNLNVLPMDKNSLFRHINTDISGMTVPWLYVGMCFSTFCWHSEDHYTYSANYQHFGATKTWYGIPADDAARFEEAMKEAVPELFEQQPDLLFQLVTLLQPEKLKKAGVRVYALDQRAGQFVVTFPQAYHAGFNHGFNFNEAVNFAPPDWEPFGAAAVQRLRDFRRQPVFCHEELLFTAASRDPGIKTARWLGPALQKTMDSELKARADFAAQYKRAKDHIDIDSGTTTSFPFEKDTHDLPEEDVVCSYCKAFCYLSRFVCHKSWKPVCLLHAGNFECCSTSPDERFSLSPGEHSVHLRMTNEELEKSVAKVVEVARTPELWEEKVDKLLSEGKPSVKSLRSLLAEGNQISIHWELPQLPALKTFVDRCNEWIEEALNYTTRKQQNRRKNERAWRRSSMRNQELEDRERELRNVDNIKRLLKSADALGFECPDLDLLRERSDKITEFQKRAHAALNRVNIGTVELDELIEDGKSFNIDMPEIEKLERRVRTVKWFETAKEFVERLNSPNPLSLQEVTEFIQQGKELNVPDSDTYMAYFLSQKEHGEFWEGKAKELMSNEHVNFTQLDALAKQATQLPVSKETLAAIDAILEKQREAQDRIMSLYQRSKDPDLRRRPKYKEVRDAMEALNELNSKPLGTLDLEREQKRHEDWMRRGKKLFGKANAPLHILLQHMQYVEERNEACLDLRDQPRMPVEPSSREATPDNPADLENRDVFCICRKPESGMMIECELCHEWYHGKCLKIARGKIREDDKYTCPICDYRLKIPRDAARPRLEDLQYWQDEIPNLPFQPEEEEVLDKIINKALEFRNHIASMINPMVSTPDELQVQRFYLRKIEGADVLLTNETNFLRQELHKWAPVAPEPPKLIEMSLSTRKPRPTKQQKLMNQYGVSDPEQLPAHLRPKPPNPKRKEREEKKLSASSSKQGSAGVNESHTPPGLPLGVSHSHAPSNSLPTVQDHQATFSYDAMGSSMGSSYRPQVEEPMFTTTSRHVGLSGLSQGAPSPIMPTHSAGIDPQLENMFSNPSSTTNHKPVDPMRPNQVFTSGVAHGDGSDPIDFGTFTNEGAAEEAFSGFNEALDPEAN
ncbi:PLU-1-domain-containing protein [Trichodelitschia bisporula]|uniref:PLU-1-domain-containing protein n=1 Tax=Trichodelitschia bisporula TaxID=703511 RepID=A0A6G1I453_9PEZI|nr:PLU-1-domain-containing protein [Trichodelitschia bisporula]